MSIVVNPAGPPDSDILLQRGSIIASPITATSHIADHTFGPQNVWASMQWNATTKSISSQDVKDVNFIMSSTNNADVLVTCQNAGTYQTSWSIQGLAPVTAIQSVSFTVLVTGGADKFTSQYRRQTALEIANYILPNRLDTLSSFNDFPFPSM